MTEPTQESLPVLDEAVSTEQPVPQKPTFSPPLRSLLIFCGYLMLLLGLALGSRAFSPLLTEQLPVRALLPYLLLAFLGVVIFLCGIFSVRNLRGGVFIADEWSAVWGALLYLGYFLAITLFNHHAPEEHAIPPMLWAIISPVTAILYLLILVFTIRLISRINLGARVETLMLLTSLALFLWLNPAVRAIAESWYRLKSFDRALELLPQMMERLQPTLVDDILVPFLLILTGVFFGQLLSRIIRERALLVPVGIIAGLVDIWGVFWGGAVHELAQTEAGNQVIASIGSATTAAPSVPQEVINLVPQKMEILKIFMQVAPPSNIGLGDFVFLAFFLSCAYRLGFSPVRTMWGVFVGILTVAILLAFGPTFSYLPALPFICGGALLANIPWRLSRQEWAMTGLLTLIFAGMISFSAYTSIRESAIPPEPAKPLVKNVKIEFTITAKNDRDIAQAVVQKLQGQYPKADLVLVYSQYLYKVENRRPVLSQAGFLVLDRSGKTMDTMREFFGRILPTNEKTQWKVTAQSIQPPTQSVNTVKMLDPASDTDLLKALQTFTGISSEKFAILDNPQALQKKVKGREGFVASILPTRVQLDELPSAPAKAPVVKKK